MNFIATVACATAASMVQCPMPAPQQHPFKSESAHTCRVTINELIAKFGYNPRYFKVDCARVKE